jgi:urease accessory protein
MSEVARLMQMMQHADSFFPSGAVAFSWGLETLHGEGAVRDAREVESFLLGQLCYRWATCERVVLSQVFAAMPDLDNVQRIDAAAEALALPREGREGARRAGATMLRIHAQLDTAFARAYRERVQAGAAFGHLAVVQGLVWHACGLSIEAALASAAHGLCTGVLGAAMRLGVLGYVDAQRILQRARETIAGFAALQPDAQACTFVPAAEIAMLRHEVQHARLFVN